ncbi:two-component system, OmpR family, sensor histidine kinase TctE [Jannaschia pohangensis]|uniref:histidine kinase n=2 Tax=Jannaschia pohangensis TaxID=390807 RepID=A0A1I3J5I2_9RHOB|nr:two-component system, OmpR family, sensor histidine kinase TctE [Jannaschia pohangensis]
MSIRRRLTLLLLAGAAALSLIGWLLVRDVVERAAQETQDGILGAATRAVADEMRGGVEGVEIDIPFMAFSILGAAGEDRIFYRVTVGGETVTGYGDLPLPDDAATLAPRFLSTPFRGEAVRVAVIDRTLLAGGRSVPVRVALAQGNRSRDALAARLSNRAAVVGFGFFLMAAALAVLTARSVTRPVRHLADSVARRGPDDLRPVDRPVPTELAPLVAALNGFMARLDAGADRTETFIAEAAHHIRTPLSALRARAEIALRGADEATRAHLRDILRLTDGTARTAGQLLDHAAVVHRSDQRGGSAEIDLARLADDVVRAARPLAELRDIRLTLDVPGPVILHGDRVPLEAALRNLIDNAVKYSPDESEVHVTLRPGATLTVEDRGRGLSDPPEALMRRFARGANAGDVLGTGLGLSIVETAAAALGGTLTLTPRDGGGTCATLSLPS